MYRGMEGELQYLKLMEIFIIIIQIISSFSLRISFKKIEVGKFKQSLGKGT